MKFVVDRTEIITEEDGFKYIAIFDKDNKNWYEEQKKFGQDTLKILYKKDTCKILSWDEDVSKIAPTEIGDVVEEVKNEVELSIEKRYYFVDNKVVELKANQKIENNKIIDILSEIDYLKEKKREELKEVRDKKIYENLEVKESVFQVRKQDLENFFLKKIEADFNPELKTKEENWILADNSFKKVNFEDIKEILTAFGERKREIFKHFGKLSVELEKAENIEKIEKITWSEGI
ncbi:MAG: DUF4376 domain-containing protein [Fusobacterium necrophorum]|uniref:DUF4376 domain-containing protein n=1 Tax=Fusobacterium necrophorum TaxID=859 RepID=UPI001011724E|nr:DUF4376 domain-containing protein [Fusobacterium necrophorum]MDY2573609.1 DUF4376 domain-containing protein [Fusobacterium necrophorum]MDY6173225.1 DUF4376 domain-containing protein [Fusobacterium necrophorum]RXZ26633.1 DUF4376 domain-containing protein [Fusobacterium necrophorum]